jgi:hypothetical protein
MAAVASTVNNKHLAAIGFAATHDCFPGDRKSWGYGTFTGINSRLVHLYATQRMMCVPAGEPILMAYHIGGCVFYHRYS